jgi:hypothetical protein
VITWRASPDTSRRRRADDFARFAPEGPGRTASTMTIRSRKVTRGVNPQAPRRRTSEVLRERQETFRNEVLNLEEPA